MRLLLFFNTKVDTSWQPRFSPIRSKTPSERHDRPRRHRHRRKPRHRPRYRDCCRDVASEADILALFKAADEFGTLGALVNNAGIVGVSQRVDEMSAERIQRMMAINITGSILCAREAVKRMSTRHGGKGGVIVNLSSVAAKLGAPNTYVDYAASKGAIDSFTIGLGYEVANEGIRVAAIRPGLIDTEIHASGGEPDRAHRLAHMVPMKRVGSAEEIANAIVWLMSEDASYVTSAILDVSGGR
jgi:NAD(P)-dependent dehydrogenase (short-subunit alcohol dehydrogenase family)